MAKTMAQMVARLEALTLADAVHDSKLHETEAAKNDVDGDMAFCPGCEQVTLARRIAEANPKDDDALLASEWFQERENAIAKRNKDARKERLDKTLLGDILNLIKGKK